MGYHYAISTSKKPRRAQLFFDRSQKDLLERVASYGLESPLSESHHAVLDEWTLDYLDDASHGPSLIPRDPVLVHDTLGQIQVGLDRICSGRNDRLYSDTRWAMEAALALCDEATQQQILIYLFTVP